MEAKWGKKRTPAPFISDRISQIAFMNSCGYVRFDHLLLVLEPVCQVCFWGGGVRKPFALCVVLRKKSSVTH